MAVPKPLSERVTKLPEWAQRHIRNQDDRITRLEREVLKTYTMEETNTYVDRYTLADDTPLPPDSRVKFKYGPGAWDYIEAYIHYSFKQPGVMDGIEVRASNGRLAMIAEASNTALIRCERF